MSRNAQLFINVQHCKKNGLNLFVGPFSDIAEAEAKIDLAVSDNQQIVMGNQIPIEPNKTLRAIIIKKTEARKMGLKIYSDGTYGNNLVPEIPTAENIVKGCVEEHKIIGHRGRPKKNIPEIEPMNIQQVTEEIRTLAQSMPNKIESEIPDDIWEKEIVIVKPRSQSTLDWLKQKGITGKVVEQVRNPAEIKDKVVIGWLPPRLSVNAFCIATIDLPGLRAEQRNTILSLEDMYEAKAMLRFYDVRKHIAN
jgi:hypothetical protein